RVRDLLAQIIERHTLVLSPQSLNECYLVVAEKRALMSRDDAHRFVAAWLPHCTAPYDFDVTQRAWQIQDECGFNWWDCMLLASAARAGCELFLSEDMQHERKVAGMTIVSPFKLDPAAGLVW